MRQETRTTEDQTPAHSALSSAKSQSSAEPKEVLENCRSGTDIGTDGGLTLGQNYASSKYSDSSL